MAKNCDRRSWGGVLLDTIMAAAIILYFVGSVQAATSSCRPSIASCGCKITKAGTYAVTADLDASQGLTNKGDCIDIGLPTCRLAKISHPR